MNSEVNLSPHIHQFYKTKHSDFVLIRETRSKLEFENNQLLWHNSAEIAELHLSLVRSDNEFIVEMLIGKYELKNSVIENEKNPVSREEKATIYLEDTSIEDKE